ncbi:hypothetical protein [Kribbella sp.]|uniref:hypothetical protein n=1 Tax=Kribbella sp. TaxID=1871183 RepID=UPI002D5357DA|nr:hypothetical protein [Kribbella sp.]HZX08919.1 hypothetical protein [Kribbella sp.]
MTGCSAIPRPDTVQTLTRPAITEQGAAAVIKNYNDVNNKANRTRDSDLIATVEGGDLVRQSQAGYKIDRAMKAKPDGSFSYPKSVIGAPQFSPRAAAAGLAKYLTEGARSSHAAAFEPTADIAHLLNDIVQNRVQHAKRPGSYRSITDVFTASDQSPAFITTSGTAVVFVTLTHDYTVMIGPRYTYWWAVMPENAFSPATAKYESALTETTLRDAVLLIPPKGKGRIRIAAFESQLVAAGGY